MHGVFYQEENKMKRMIDEEDHCQQLYPHSAPLPLEASLQGAVTKHWTIQLLPLPEVRARDPLAPATHLQGLKVTVERKMLSHAGLSA